MSVKVFGITGTNGKTTVSYMLRNILKTAGKKCDLIGTISHHIGDKEYVAINTTPGAELLAEYFQKMKEQKSECCVMEVSSHGLVQGRVDAIPIDYAGFTNLSQDHLDYHHSMEEYYSAKRELFYMSQKANIINEDDIYGSRLYHELGPKRAFSYSMKSRNAFYFGEIKNGSEEKTQIDFREQGQSLGRLTINMPGLFSVYNALLAAGLARTDGIEFEDIQTGLYDLSGVPGRLETFYGRNGVTVIVDFAHTPDALENLLRTLRMSKGKGRLISVFGCGGNRDKDKRQKMGRIAGDYSDYTIITSDNPRTEDPEDIAAEIEEGLYDTGCDYRVIIDRYQAIKTAVTLARSGDIIAIAGKGHETYQIIGSEKRPFDDRQIVKEELGK